MWGCLGGELPSHMGQTTLSFKMTVEYVQPTLLVLLVQQQAQLKAFRRIVVSSNHQLLKGRRKKSNMTPRNAEMAK